MALRCICPVTPCWVGMKVGKHPPGSWLDDNGELHLPAVSATDIKPLPETLISFAISASFTMGGEPEITARLNDRVFDLAPMSGVQRSPEAEALIQSLYETLKDHFANHQGAYAVGTADVYDGQCAMGCDEPLGEHCDTFCIAHCASLGHDHGGESEC